MTTAYQTTRTGPPPSQKQAFGGPFDFGAGHVDATLALDPGLIIDSGAPDWQRFMCGISEVPHNTWDQHAECRPCQVALADAACAPSKYESMTAAQVSRCVACDPSNFNTPSSEYYGKHRMMVFQSVQPLCGSAAGATNPLARATSALTGAVVPANKSYISAADAAAF